MAAQKPKTYSRSWLCEDCTLAFDVHKILGKVPVCPECGDRIAVRRHKGDRNGDGRKSGPGSKLRWKAEELALLEACLNGKELPYRAAIILGRNTNSVTKRLGRMRKEKDRNSTK